MTDIVETTKQKIIDYANNDKEYGWVKVTVEGKPFKFPKRALIWYVFGNSSAAIPLLPEYESFCGRDFKMYNDNAYHSDAWLGAGLDIDKAYDHDGDIELAQEAFHEAKDIIEDEMQKVLSFDFTVLANALPDKLSSASMMVYEADKDLPSNISSNIHIQSQKKTDLNKYSPQLKAICIPKAGVEYQLLAENADVIITETGGKLVHLATIARESGKLLIRVDNAMKKFPKFSKLYIDLNTLTLRADTH